MNSTAKLKTNVEYTVFQGRAGDHNDLAMPGAKSIGEFLARRTGVEPYIIGTPEPALNTGWKEELAVATPSLKEVQARFEQVISSGAMSIAATSRCAVSIATLPIVAKYHPSVCIVWFDSHADLNTPETTTTGYLGGLAFSASLGMWDSGFGSGLNLNQIILVGQRDIDPFEQDLIDERGIIHIKPEDNLEESLRTAIAGRPVYVHLDCDVLDPGIVPTDYVHENGLSLEDLHTCCRVMAEQKVVGVEIAEFQNAWTDDGEAVSPEPLLDALQPILNANK